MKTNENFLQNKEGGKKQATFEEKALRIVAGVITVGVFIIILVISSYLGMFGWLAMKVRLLTGLDMWLVKSLTFVLMAIFFGTPLGSFVWSFFPFPMKNRKQKRFIFLSVLAALCFMTFFTSKNVYFDPATGEPRMYYSIGVDGEYKLFESDGFDTQTGDKLLPITKEIIQKMNELEAKKNEIKIDTVTVVPEVSQQNHKRIRTGKPNLLSEPKKKSGQSEVKTEADSNIKPDTNNTIKTKEQVPKELTKVVPEIPHGYEISMLNNKRLGELGNLFGGGPSCTIPQRPISCKITFQNNSSGTFHVYNFNKSILFKIPPKRTIASMFDPNIYYIRSSESKELIVMRIPNREELFLEISDSDIPAPGEIFFGSASSGNTLHTTSSGGGAIGN